MKFDAKELKDALKGVPVGRHGRLNPGWYNLLTFYYDDDEIWNITLSIDERGNAWCGEAGRGEITINGYKRKELRELLEHYDDEPYVYEMQQRVEWEQRLENER